MENALVLDVDKPDVFITLSYPVRRLISMFQEMETIYVTFPLP